MDRKRRDVQCKQQQQWRRRQAGYCLCCHQQCLRPQTTRHRRCTAPISKPALRLFLNQFFVFFFHAVSCAARAGALFSLRICPTRVGHTPRFRSNVTSRCALGCLTANPFCNTSLQTLLQYIIATLTIRDCRQSCGYIRLRRLDHRRRMARGHCKVRRRTAFCFKTETLFYSLNPYCSRVASESAAERSIWALHTATMKAVR